ncbi:MAG TPA: hypothetical protein VFG04_15770 [Planctomycetaceae bacterium]|jgi:hypothetical protein|nr:hypothetical protein [Planctomycetaceae bacterium]
MSDERATLTFPRLRKAYFVGNGLAAFITLVAGLVNLVIGPRNPGIFLVVLFQLVFATVVLVLMDAVNSQPRSPSWIRLGSTWMQVRQDIRGIVSLSFLCFTPTFFLFVSVVLLYAAIVGTITPLNAQL